MVEYSVPFPCLTPDFMSNPLFYSVMMIEDEPNVSEPISIFVEQQNDMSMAGVFRTVEDFLQNISAGHFVTTLLLDISLPGGMTGIRGIQPIQERFPNLDIIMITTANDVDTVYSALEAGAVGYLDKTTGLKEVVKTIRDVGQGGSYMSPKIARKIITKISNQGKKPQEPSENTPRIQLTKKQMEVVKGLVEGLSYKLIAHKMNISVETVNSHIKTIYRRLKVHSRTQVINIYHDDQIVEKGSRSITD